MTRGARFFKSTRGSVITEFTLSMLMIFMVLLTTMEFGIEVFARQSAERAAGAAAEAYALSRDPDQAMAAAMNEVIAPMNACIKPLKITIHNNMTSLKGGTGRDAKGNSADNGARIARVALRCEWSRITPLPRVMLGPKMNHSVVSYVRIR